MTVCAGLAVGLPDEFAHARRADTSLAANSQVEEIIVTAHRPGAMSIQRIPTAMTAFSSKELN